jgi:hypothetical protein
MPQVGSSAEFDGSWDRNPYQTVETRSLAALGPDYPLFVVTVNLGKFRGSEKEQRRLDYCDIVIRATSPLALDFSGRGFLPYGQLQEGMRFDLNADGRLEKMSSLGGDAGLLAIDLNKNGIIDDGRELFGDRTQLPSGQTAQHGFEALAQYDSNKDLKIDFQDPIWVDLRAWVDSNRNGDTDSGELQTLAERGVTELQLDYIEKSETDIFGNEALQRSLFKDSRGQLGHLVDIWFLTIEEL